MLAHAFLTIVAEHARAPGPERQIAITRDQIVHLDTALISHPARSINDACGFTGRTRRSKRVAWRLVMALRIVCMCGYVIQGGDDDELWANARGHMGVLHPELVDSVTREDLLAQAELL
jgi:predicted small metal-binding protein